MATALLVVLLGWFVVDRFGPATVPVHGTWTIEPIENDGRVIVTPADLSGMKVQAQSGDDSSLFSDGTLVIDDGCEGRTGSYRMLLDNSG